MADLPGLDIPDADPTSIALSYAVRGWPVFACWWPIDRRCACRKPNCQDAAKHPVGSLVPHGVSDATTHRETIQRWWSQAPQANVAIATGAGSGLVVVDIDPDKGGDESLFELEKRYGRLPATVEVLTGGGGRHLYFQHPGRSVRNRVGVASGIDIRGDGGYVLAPPSRHISGRSYCWEVSGDPDETPLAPLPTWLVTLVNSGSDRICEPPATEAVIAEGARNATLASLAGSMRRRGMSPSAIEAALLAENIQRCQPPLPDDEVRRIAQSIARYDPDGGTLETPSIPSGEGRICLADVQAEVVRWLWRGRIPLGKLTVVDGDPGLGKSTILLDIAARVTTGRGMPDGARSDLDGPAGVILLSDEDGLADTIRPRLDAADADLSLVHARKSVVEITLDDDGIAQRDVRPPELPNDLKVLAEDIEAKGAKLVIIDPLMAYLSGRTNTNRDHDVRRAVTPMAVLAEHTGAAIVVIRHLNKNGGSDPLYRGGGSIGIIGAARSGLLVARDPDDETGERRILAVMKSNLAAPVPALAFRLQETGEVTKVEWQGATEHRAADLLTQPISGEERSRVDDAEAFLLGALADGPRRAHDVQREAKTASITDRTLDRAKRNLGISAQKEGFGTEGYWSWRLPEPKGANPTLRVSPKSNGALSDPLAPLVETSSVTSTEHLITTLTNLRSDVLKRAAAAGWPELTIGRGETVLGTDAKWHLFINASDEAGLLRAQQALSHHFPNEGKPWQP